MADERDPVAGMLNREGKGGEEADAANANYTDAFDAPQGQGVMGTGQDPQHRAPAGDGFRAPLAEKSDAPPQYSSFDSKGNERVVVLGTNEQGQPAQGVGPDTASAQADAESGTSQIGDMGADE